MSKYILNEVEVILFVDDFGTRMYDSEISLFNLINGVNFIIYSISIL
jgi:hypothetical protein